MKLADLFKSSKELEQEKRQVRRAMERQVERAIERNRDRIAEIDKERRKTWEKAKARLAGGQRTEAARLLQTYKAQGLQIDKLERQNSFVRNQLDRLSAAEDMSKMAAALKNLGAAMGVDVAKFEEDMAEVNAASEGVTAMDKAMERAANRDQERLEAEAAAARESLEEDDELMAALIDDAAAHAAAEKTAAKRGSESRRDAADAGREQLTTPME